MATVTEPRSFNHEETQRKVRHPLHLVRRYIRRYIILEGIALTLLCASILFWIGLAFDFGLYKFRIDAANIYGIDWILELNDLDPTGNSSLGIRAVLLGVIVVALLVLGFSKVVTRWFREFNDRSLALVLERRFPKELGDRLITAVELADPKLSKKYGYSQAMVEKTILEAIQTLKGLPVAGVFNWRRLFGLWFLLGLSTVGMLVLTMAAFCGGSLIVAEEPMTPVAFAYKFYDTGVTWTERNVLMMNTYWPRNAYLEIGRFQRSKEDASEMRVAKDDANRPELQVRAYEWVIADRDREAAPHGWRAMTWKDLSDYQLVEPALLARVKIPAEFEHWLIDPEELEPNLVAALFDTATHERSRGELENHFQKPAIAKKIEDREARKELGDWLDWHNWKMDKLTQQLADPKVGAQLRDLDNADSLNALEEIVAKLNELAESPGMTRTLRKLAIPEEIAVSFRGEASSFSDNRRAEAGNKYTVSLKDLKDSNRFRLRVRGDDYYTQPKKIALVAAPAPAKISIDKEEPAYIYHRLRGIDQMALKGERHITKNLALSTTGDSNTIEVPLGSKLVIHMETDRKLRSERSIFIKDNSSLPEGFDHYRGSPPAVDADRGGFTLVMDNLSRKHEFSVEYFDEDNIRGKRRFKVLALIDQEPQLGNLHVHGVLLRKPKFKLPERKDNDAPLRDLTELASSYLITPDAILPFECSVRDEYGLVRSGYDFKYRVEDFDLFSGTAPKKSAPKVEADPVIRRAAPAIALGLPLIAWASLRADIDLQPAVKYTDGYAPAAGFEQVLERMDPRMIFPQEIKKFLTERRAPTPWDFDFKDDRKGNDHGFDLRVHLPNLKAVNLEQTGQAHYLLKISVQATDNNVETGAPYSVTEGNEVLQLRGNTKRNKNGMINFLVVSENQLLSQIALDEESIFEKLEVAKEKVDASLVSLSEQQAKIVGDPNVDMDNILIRMNEIRTALADTSSKVRDAHQAYGNILAEMRINRVRADRKEKIEKNIYDPLNNIIFENPFIPGSGSSPLAEDTFHDVHRQVEADVNAGARPNAALHRKNMAAADQRLAKLSKDINHILDAMSEGIVEAKLIALLVGIEEKQRKATQWFQDEHKRMVLELLEKELGIGKPKDPPKEEKKDEKKDEKKSSLNHLQLRALLVSLDRERRAETPAFLAARAR